MGCIGLILTVGTRGAFALILTHVTASNATAAADDVIFSGCTVLNTSRGPLVDMGGDTMFLLHTAYFIGYFAMTLPSGVICTWVSPVRLTGGMMMLGSTISLVLPSVIGVSWPLLFTLRVVQGLSEGGQQPVIIGLISAWSTQHDKASLNAVFITGIYLASLVSSLLTSTCICFIRWDTIFYIYGSAGLVWSAVWVTKFYDTPQRHPTLPEDERLYHSVNGSVVKDSSSAVLKAIPWRQICSSLAVWSIFLGSFGRNLVFSFMVVEQPQYFLDCFNMKAADIGMLGMVPHLGLCVTCLMGGVLSDRLLRCGLSTTATRKLAFSTGVLVEGVCLVALNFAEDWSTALILLSTGVSIGGLSTSGYVPLAADMAPQYAGVITGLSQLGSSGAIISTVLASTMTGTNRTIGSWQKLFLVSGVLHLSIMVLFDVFADARQQPWAGQLSSNNSSNNSRSNNVSRNNSRRSSSSNSSNNRPGSGGGDCDETALLAEGDEDAFSVGIRECYGYGATEESQSLSSFHGSLVVAR